MHETLIKRTIYVAQCNCKGEESFRTIKDKNPPREVRCPDCGTWLEFKEESYIGKDKFTK